MSYRSNRKVYHYYIQLFLIAAFAMGLLLSKIILSLSLMAMLLNLLILADFKNYVVQIKANKTILWILGFYILHLISLIWSNDLPYGFADIRIKIPLLILPLVFASMPVKSSDLKWILIPFTITATITTLVNYVCYNHWIGNLKYDDFRDMSLFGSHIRFGLMISFAIAISLYQASKLPKYRFLFVLIGLWLTYYTLYSQVLSGLIAFLIVCVLAIWYFIQTKWIRKLYLFVLLGVTTIILAYFIIPPKAVSFEAIPKLSKTEEGNPYSSFNDAKYRVNGEPKFINVAIDELKREWVKHSHYDLFGSDDQHCFLIFTLVKYLDDLKLEKNAKGMSKLTLEDYRNIEKGLSHPPYIKRSILERVKEIKYQLHSTNDISYSNTLERLIYWKIACQIIQENWLVGVGSGNVQAAFEEKYAKNDFSLAKNHQLRAHQNYLTAWISFGVFGLLYFIFLWYLFIKNNFKYFISTAFISIVIGSFLIEDTLETQVGASFVAVFYCLFLSLEKKKITFS